MKMWEIRESDSYRDDYRFGKKRPSIKGYKDYDDDDKAYAEGYECGYEDGYTKAMKDTFYSHSEKDSYGERRMSR